MNLKSKIHFCVPLKNGKTEKFFFCCVSTRHFLKLRSCGYVVDVKIIAVLGVTPHEARTEKKLYTIDQLNCFMRKKNREKYTYTKRLFFFSFSLFLFFFLGIHNNFFSNACLINSGIYVYNIPFKVIRYTQSQTRPQIFLSFFLF